jgi:sn-glycerol 3-phosphate transport system permease protein
VNDLPGAEHVDPPGGENDESAPAVLTGDEGAAQDGDTAAAPELVPSGRSRRSQRAREAALGYALVAPALVVFVAFVFYPFVRNFELSLYRSNPARPELTEYAGFSHAWDTLWSDYVQSSLWTTVVFALMTVPAGIFLGLALAVAAHQRLRGIAIYRLIFSSTIATSVAVAAVIFGTLFQPQIGYLPWLGFSPDPPLVENTTWALPSVAFVTVWQNIGFAFIIMSAGLQAVPDEVLEAAQVDGARAWRRFWRVTVPLLSPTIFFAIVVGSIMAFQTFGQVHLLTEGGPGESTNIMAYAIYDSIRGADRDPSRAAALSIALFFVTLVVTVVQLRVLEKRVHYA